MMFLRVYLDMGLFNLKKSGNFMGYSWDNDSVMGIKQDIEPTIVQFGCV